ncbi:hypothetical protein IWX48DRAFT_643833 [Phyllosticta citricarpa]
MDTLPTRNPSLLDPSGSNIPLIAHQKCQPAFRSPVHIRVDGLHVSPRKPLEVVAGAARAERGRCQQKHQNSNSNPFSSSSPPPHQPRSALSLAFAFAVALEPRGAIQLVSIVVIVGRACCQKSCGCCVRSTGRPETALAPLFYVTGGLEAGFEAGLEARLEAGPRRSVQLVPSSSAGLWVLCSKSGPAQDCSGTALHDWLTRISPSDFAVEARHRINPLKLADKVRPPPSHHALEHLALTFCTAHSHHRPRLSWHRSARLYHSNLALAVPYSLFHQR